MNPDSLKRRLRKIDGPEDFKNKVDIDTEHRVHELATAVHGAIHDLIDHNMWEVSDEFILYPEVEPMTRDNQESFAPSWEWVSQAEFINKRVVEELRKEYGIEEVAPTEVIDEDGEYRYLKKGHFTPLGVSFIEKWKYPLDDYGCRVPLDFALELRTFSDIEDYGIFDEGQ